MPSAEEYLEDAQREYERATKCLKARDYEYACFHSQQCAELALKAFLASRGNYVRIHSLPGLYERAHAELG